MFKRSESDAGPHAALAIIEKYEQFVAYLYPVLQNVPRRHGVARDMVLTTMFNQAELLITAAKVRQVSKLYAADANLATLRFWLRFMADPARRLITPQQHKVALGRLAEVGKMLGAWIRSVKSGG